METAVKKAKTGKDQRTDTLFFLSETYTDYVSNDHVRQFKDDLQNIHISLAVHGNEAISPVRASFGGFNRFADACSMSSLLHRMEIKLKEKGVDTIRIRLFPAVYDSRLFAKQLRFFLEKGYDIAHLDINQHVVVSDICPYTPGERAVLRRNHAMGLSCHLESIDALEEAYEVLAESRARKGYPITMDYQSLQDSFLQFPSHYLLFSVRHHGLMVAIAVCIRIRPQILYHFYHADIDDYHHLSPTVSIVNHIRNYALSRRIEVMDLGISTEKGRLNYGLYQFKRRLGAVDSPKPMLRKSL